MVAFRFVDCNDVGDLRLGGIVGRECLAGVFSHVYTPLRVSPERPYRAGLCLIVATAALWTVCRMT